MAGAATPLLVDPTALGLPYDGIGGVNGGNGARLLANYPQPQRDAVLDLLFAPQVGCALDILKVIFSQLYFFTHIFQFQCRGFWLSLRHDRT